MTVSPPDRPSRWPLVLIVAGVLAVTVLAIAIVMVIDDRSEPPRAQDGTTTGPTTSIVVGSVIASPGDGTALDPSATNGGTPAVGEPPGDEPAADDGSLMTVGQLAPGACPGTAPAVPFAHSVLSQIPTDMDGDGEVDWFSAYGYADGAGDLLWRARIEFQNGFAAEVPYQGTEGLASGGHALTGVAGPEFAFVVVDYESTAVIGGGAGPTDERAIIGLFRFDGCALHEVVGSDGLPIRFPVGETVFGDGSVGNRGGLTCRPDRIEQSQAVPISDLPGYDWTVWTTTWTWDPGTSRLQEGQSMTVALCCRRPDHDAVIFGFVAFDCD